MCSENSKSMSVRFFVENKLEEVNKLLMEKFNMKLCFCIDLNDPGDPGEFTGIELVE